jgi:hypothetical protein
MRGVASVVSQLTVIPSASLDVNDAWTTFVGVPPEYTDIHRCKILTVADSDGFAPWVSVVATTTSLELDRAIPRE